MVLVIRQSIVSRNKKTVLHVAKLQFRPSIVVPATLNVRCWNNISIFDCGNFATEGICVTPHHELLLPFICFMHGRCMDLSGVTTQTSTGWAGCLSCLNCGSDRVGQPPHPGILLLRAVLSAVHECHMVIRRVATLIVQAGVQKSEHPV